MYMTHGSHLLLLMLSWQLVRIYPAITRFARGWNDEIRQIVYVNGDSVKF